MKFISGRKMSMTQIWLGEEVAAVTPVQAGPGVITQVKTRAKDGYAAVQLAYGTRQAKNIKKPQLGHYKKTGVQPAYVREFRLDKDVELQAGDIVTAATFAVGDIVAVTGTSKGKGFQGVVKRHRFHGHPASHGHKDQERMSGSIGAKGPAHVFKGTRMGGRMGGERVTTTNLEIKAVDAVNNILFIKGAIPGASNGFVMIQGAGELQVNLKPAVSEAAVAVPAETVAPAAVTAETVAADKTSVPA
jgi:large subunit ribosomal protein L3